MAGFPARLVNISAHQHARYSVVDQVRATHACQELSPRTWREYRGEFGAQRMVLQCLQGITLQNA